MLLATSLLLVGCGSSSSNKDVGIPDGPSVVADLPNAPSLDTIPDLAPMASADGLFVTPDATVDIRPAEIEVGDAPEAAGTTLDATLKDALATQDGPAEWGCGTQTCHTGQVCVQWIPGAVGVSQGPPSCEDLGAGCSDACECVCPRSEGAGCYGDTTSITCTMP